MYQGQWSLSLQHRNPQRASCKGFTTRDGECIDLLLYYRSIPEFSERLYFPCIAKISPSHHRRRPRKEAPLERKLRRRTARLALTNRKPHMCNLSPKTPRNPGKSRAHADQFTPRRQSPHQNDIIRRTALANPQVFYPSFGVPRRF